MGKKVNTKKEIFSVLLPKAIAQDMRKIKQEIGIPLGKQVENALRAQGLGNGGNGFSQSSHQNSPNTDGNGAIKGEQEAAPLSPSSKDSLHKNHGFQKSFHINFSDQRRKEEDVPGDM